MSGEITKKTILLILMSILSLNILLGGCIDTDSVLSLSLDEIPPIILFLKKQNHLMVIKADPGLDWSNVEIVSGQCMLSTGPIHAGDVVTNCTGNVILRWIPSNLLIGDWQFT